MNMNDSALNALVLASAVNELYQETLKFFALIVNLDPGKCEKLLLNAIEETKKRPHLMADEKIAEKVKGSENHIIMLGCLERFKQDMIANHPYAREANRQFEEKMDGLLKDLGLERRD